MGLKEVQSSVSVSAPSQATGNGVAPELKALSEKTSTIAGSYLDLCAKYHRYGDSADVMTEVLAFSEKVDADLTFDEDFRHDFHNVFNETCVRTHVARAIVETPCAPVASLQSTNAPPAKRRALSSPAAQQVSTHGLPNLGSTCFANAAIQFLFHTRGIDRLLNQKLDLASDPEVTNFQAKIQEAKKSGNEQEVERLTGLLNQEIEKVPHKEDFQKNLKALWTEYQKMHPDLDKMEKLLEKLWASPLLQKFSMRVRQEDASEFLGTLFEVLRVDHVSIGSIRSNGSGKIVQEETKKETVRLPVAGTLQKCVDEYLKDEKLDKENIPVENPECKIKRLFFQGQPPDMIQLGLNRFDKNGHKIRTSISGFNQPVRIPFVHEGKTTYVAYEVEAVICHDGRTPQSGHYTALVKTPDGWTLFNDGAEPRHPTPEELKSIETQGYFVRLRRV